MEEALDLSFDRLQLMMMRHKREVPGTVHMGLLVDEVAFGRAIFQILLFYPVISLYQFTVQSLLYPECYLVSAANNDVK